MGSSLRTWAKACVRRHIPTYAARVLEAWKRQVFYNNGWGLEWIPHHLGAIPNPIFQLYKALHGIFQKHIENPKGKPKITRNKERVFHKTSSCQFYLIEAFPSLDLSSLRLLITFVFDCEQIDWGEQLKSSLKSFLFEALSSKPFLFISSFWLFINLFSCFIYV